MIELGASYAPFAAISGVLAKRQNFNEICLLACEAAPRGIEHLQRNLEVNGLLNDPRVKVQVINGAVAARNGHVYFPDVDSTQDNGGKIKGVLHKLLSIGKPNKLARVKAYSLQSLLELNREQAIVDFIHCDIQGAEYDVFASCMPLLGKRVRRVFVATHSRTIEDRLFSLFDRSGWHLVAEDACKLGYNLTSSAEKLRLWADGGQYWRNRQLT
jgi:FkbM family methyltransferase